MSKSRYSHSVVRTQSHPLNPSWNWDILHSDYLDLAESAMIIGQRENSPRNDGFTLRARTSSGIASPEGEADALGTVGYYLKGLGAIPNGRLSTCSRPGLYFLTSQSMEPLDFSLDRVSLSQHGELICILNRLIIIGRAEPL